MIKEIKIMDPEKYSGFEKHAIGIELEKDSLGGAGFREKYGIKKPPVHLGKPLNTQVPIGSNYQADIPPKQGGRKRKRRKTKKRRRKSRRKRKKKRRTKKAGVIPRQSIKPGSRGLTDKEQWLRMYHKKKQDFKKERKKTSEIQDKLNKSIQKLKSANKSRNLPNISPLTITPSPRQMKMTKFMTSPMTTPAQSPKTGGRKKRRTRRKKGGGDFYMVALGDPPTKYWVQPQNEDGDIKVRSDPYVLYEFKEIKTDEPLKPIKLLEVKLVDGKKQYIVKNIAMPKK
jgi:hypothetical protein